MTDPESEDPNPPEEQAVEAPPNKRRRWMVALAVGLPLVVVIIAVATITPSQLSGDPELCTSCHAEDVSEIHGGAHTDVTCIECHQDDPDQNFEVWLAQTLPGGDSTAPHGEARESMCVDCHTQGDFEPWHMAATRGHRSHVLEPDDPLECFECHSWEEHDVEPEPEACADCHDDTRVFTHQDDEIECLSCHNYLASVGGGAQTPSTECRRCHGGTERDFEHRRFANVVEGEPVNPTQIHGNLETCSLCHNPHPADPEAREKGQDCSRCHGTVEEEYHAQQRPAEFECGTCHTAHSPRQKLTESCAECHGSTVRDTGTLASQHEKCTGCHEVHEFVATMDGCRECHEEQQTMLAAWEPPEKHENCANCHEPHTHRRQQATCADCHRQATARHDACTTCHEPHQSASEVGECADCHELQGAQARSSRAHRQQGCQTCHTLHSNRSPSNECRQCHSQEVRLVSRANVREHGVCSSCHTNHRFQASLSSCQSCHSAPSAGAHTGACNQCHEQHGRPIGRAAQCSNCHGQVPRVRGPHFDCSTCHREAHGPGLEPPACYNCHQEQEVATRRWTEPTHQGCYHCHENHTATHPSTCTDCHPTEARGVRRTSHQCQSCHETHAPVPNLWGRCSSCHAPIARAVQPRGPTHSECQQCHEPHQGSLPRCTSCHTTLPGLHGISDHRQCTSCHDTHAQRTPTRQECLSCHTAQRRTHFPEAETCLGCHLFGPE